MPEAPSELCSVPCYLAAPLVLDGVSVAISFLPRGVVDDRERVLVQRS